MQTLVWAPLTAEHVKPAIDAVLRIRAKRPRIHCVTNAVAQNFTANVLLAAGAVPSMTVAADEIADFVAGADALLVNLGTFDRERREAVEIAVKEAANSQRPWVLDPVFVDRSIPRAQFARALLARSPVAIRLNAAEFAAVADAQPGEETAKRLALDRRCVVALSGAVDIVTDGTRTANIRNGDPLMARVTAMGCAGTALVTALRSRPIPGLPRSGRFWRSASPANARPRARGDRAASRWRSSMIWRISTPRPC